MNTRTFLFLARIWDQAQMLMGSRATLQQIISFFEDRFLGLYWQEEYHFYIAIKVIEQRANY